MLFYNIETMLLCR